MSFRPTPKTIAPTPQTGSNYAHASNMYYSTPYTGSEALYYNAPPRTAVDFNNGGGGYRSSGYGPQTAAAFSYNAGVPHTAMHWENNLPSYWGENDLNYLGQYAPMGKKILGGMGKCMAYGIGIESEMLAEKWLHDYRTR